MGNEPNLRPMTRISAYLVHLLTEVLDADERQIVLGDIAENSTASNRAVGDLLGLVIRRQVDQWTDWRPWVTLVAVIFPLAMVLSIVSGRFAGGSSVYLWMYANNWHRNDVKTVGFWEVLGQSAYIVAVGQLMLACWGWTGGFVVGALSRKAIQRNYLLLLLMLMIGAAVGAPLYEGFYGQYLHRVFGMPSLPDPNAPVFAVAFYRQSFPLIVQAVSVVIPALWGIRKGAVLESSPAWLRKLMWTVAVVSLLIIFIQNQDLWIFTGVPMRPHFLPGWLSLLLQLTVYWPMFYLAAVIGQFFRTKLSLRGQQS
jgi:hypothetical protein